MVKLNLLPPKERTKKQTIKENFIALLLSLTTIAIIITFAISLMFIQNSVAFETKIAEDNIKKQEDRNSAYKDIENTIMELNENIDLIAKLEKTNVTWSKILQELRNKIPPEGELTAITATVQTASAKKTQTAGPIIITLNGTATNLFSIAKYRESLATSEYFDYVDFESANTSPSGLMDFTLKIRIKNNG